MNGPSINDECQTQHAVWPAKQTRIWWKLMVTAGQETWCDMVAKHCEGSQEDVKRTPQPMSLCPFEHFSNCGGGHLRCGSSCHFLSHPLTFGILGCMPYTDAGNGMTTAGIILDKGTCRKDKDICWAPFLTTVQDYIKQEFNLCICFFFICHDKSWTLPASVFIVNHNILLRRLKHVIEINGTALGWFR